MLVITSDQKEGAQDKDIASEPDDDQPKAPQRKRKKIEEPMFSCPMCGMKFIESEINQHAFTCNPEPKRESRSQARWLGLIFWVIFLHVIAWLTSLKVFI